MSYAEGALRRARTADLQPAVSTSELLVALHEIVEALDRRIPNVERAGESEILRDAERLRACALRRIASLTEVHRAEAALLR
jgi:hypothetical protein